MQQHGVFTHFQLRIHPGPEWVCVCVCSYVPWILCILCNVAKFFSVSLICFFNCPSFLPLSPHHILFWCCISAISFAPGLLCTVSLFLSTCPAVPQICLRVCSQGLRLLYLLTYSLLSQVNAAKTPLAHCRPLLDLLMLTLPLLPFAYFNPLLLHYY